MGKGFYPIFDTHGNLFKKEINDHKSNNDKWWVEDLINEKIIEKINKYIDNHSKMTKEEIEIDKAVRNMYQKKV